MKMLLFLVLFILVSCQTNSKWTREEFQAHMNASPIHKPEYWNKWINLPLDQRVIAATPEMVAFLKDDNEFNKYPTSPKTVRLTAENKAVIKEAIGSLPSWIKKPIEKNITGIMIVKDLGSSALTDAIRGFKNKGFIVFDIKTLTKAANDWCAWKENTAFKEGDHKIKCTLENGKENNKVNAFRYIFLHEAAHILNMGSSLLPFWNNESKKSPSDTNKYAFLKLSWKFSKKGWIVKKDKYKHLKQVAFYKPEWAKDNNLMVESYKELKNSDFSTLYGVTNAWDDLAESYVNYIHTQILKKPFKIEIFKKDQLVYSYTNCWQEKRCQQKKRIVQRFIKGN